MAALTDDVVDMQIRMEDFVRALEEVHPLFGTFSEIQSHIQRCSATFADSIRNSRILLTLVQASAKKTSTAALKAV